MYVERSNQLPLLSSAKAEKQTVASENQRNPDYRYCAISLVSHVSR
jgi:hypothetical protein